MHKKTIIFSIAAFFIGVIVASTYWYLQQSTAQNETNDTTKNVLPVKLGWVSALTGGASTFGVPAHNAAQLAVTDINNNGGINGRKLELIVEDGKCNAKEASLAANKLVNNDRVPVIFTNCSTETLAVAAVTEPNHVITMGAVTTSTKVSDAGDYVFRVSPKDTKGTQMLAQYALDNGYTKIALIIANDAFASSVQEDFEKYYIEHGGSVLFTENFHPDQNDFRSELTKIKESDVHAFLFVPIKPLNAVTLLEQKEKLGIIVPMLTHRTVVNPDILDRAGSLIEGAVYTDIKFDDSRNQVQEFLQTYRGTYGKEPTFTLQLVAGVYDGVHLVADAIRSCEDEHNADCIRDYLYATNNYKGVSGTLTMDENGDPDMEFELMTVKNGTITKVQ